MSKNKQNSLRIFTCNGAKVLVAVPRHVQVFLNIAHFFNNLIFRKVNVPLCSAASISMQAR